MDGIKHGIIALIKSAITGQSLPLPEDFDINKAAPVLKRRGLITLGYAGAVNCGIDPELPVMLKMQEEYLIEYYRSDCQMKRLQEVFDAFEQNGIEYMPIKGSILKSLYPSHEMRRMTDADVLIKVEQYPQVRSAMLSIDFSETKESDHEYIWDKEGLNIELHKHLIPSYHSDYYRYFGVGWEKAAVRQGNRWFMTNEDAFIYDFVHFTKHFRTSGVKCRMVIDLWIYLRSFPELDRTYIRQEMDKLELGAFYDNMICVIDAWFCDGAWDEKTEFISDYILDGGALKEVAERAKTAKSIENIRAANQKMFWKKIFPSKNNIEWNYPELKHLPLPAAWVARWGLLLTVRRKNVENRANQIHSISNERVEEHLKGLDYVGLKFSE